MSQTIPHCLNKVEMRSLIDYCVSRTPITDEYLAKCVEHAEAWAYEIIGMNYIFAHLLERARRDGHDTKVLLDSFYQIESSGRMFFHIQELNGDFLEFMLRTISDRNLTLEEKLVEIQTKLSARQYGGLVTQR